MRAAILKESSWSHVRVGAVVQRGFQSTTDSRKNAAPALIRASPFRLRDGSSLAPNAEMRSPKMKSPSSGLELDLNMAYVPWRRTFLVLALSLHHLADLFTGRARGALKLHIHANLFF